MKCELKTDTPPPIKIALIVILVVGISLLHYLSDKSQYYYHIFYGELYFLPIVLAAYWFGLCGALTTSLTITACYVPFVFWHWQGLSPGDFDRILSVALYNISAVFIGTLHNREKRAVKRLLKSESLVAMGQSLAAVAHDIKTPLVLIGGFTQQALKQIEKNNPACDKLTIVIKETGRLESMMNDMLDFSRPLSVDLLSGDLNKIVEECTAIVSETARKRAVTIEHMLSSDIPMVIFDPMRLKQVIVNLVSNAVESSHKGDIVTICTSNAHDGVIIDVIDSGSGISVDNRKKVFDPFFSTKKKGTGLGLAIVKKIMEAHDGSLEILDNSPCGTIFRVMLFRPKGTPKGTELT